MIRRLTVLTLMCLAACSDPRLGAGLSLGSHGVSLRPSISGALPGGGRLSYSP
jgi:hypothetical protein